MIFTTLIGTTLMVMPILSDPFLVSKSLFLMLAVSIWLGFEFLQGRDIAAPSRRTLTLWLLAGVLSLGTAQNPFAAMQLWALALALLIFCSGHRGIGERPFLGLVAGLGVVQVLLGSAQMWWLPSPATFVDFPQRLKFAGTLGNPQYVASFLGLGVCLLSFSTQRTRWRWAAVAILLLGVAISRVQATSLCLFATLIVFSPISRRQKCLVIGGAFAIVVAFKSYLHWHTFHGRMLLFATAAKMAWDSGGWGVGLGQFGNQFLPVQRELLALGSFAFFRANAGFAEHPHNEYLALVAELGLFGLILFSYALYRLQKLPLSRRLLALLFFTSLDALFSFPWRLVPIALIVGLTLYREVPVSRRWYGPRLALASVFLMIVSLLGFSVQYAEGRADRLARQGRIPEAERSVDFALRLAPHRSELCLLKGRLRYFQFDAEQTLWWARRANHIGERIDSLKLEGLALMDLRRWEDAERLYLRLAATLPNQITAHYYLGEIYTRQNRVEEAKREFSLLSSQRTKNAKAVVDQWRAKDFL